MAELGEENKVSNVFGGVNFENNTVNVSETVESENKSLAKPGIWGKFKSFLFQEIKVELTPYQQKVEDEINEFLHQEITWEKVHDFLFQEVTFGKNKQKV
jgi:hypothetical protein